jgi:hypothetical protein
MRYVDNPRSFSDRQPPIPYSSPSLSPSHPPITDVCPSSIGLCSLQVSDDRAFDIVASQIYNVRHRNKKIKCDSKHPKCSACASAGVDCHQEDRYHQRLTPRGHTEQLQAQRDHAEVILKSICGPDFDLALATQTGMIPYPYLIPGPPGAAPGQLPSPNMDAPGPSQHHGPPNVVLYPAGIFPPGMIPASMPPPPHMLSHSAYMHGPPAPESVLPEYGFSQTVLKGVDPQKNDVTNERVRVQLKKKPHFARC